MIYIQPNISYQQPYPPEVQPPLRVVFISVAECSRIHTGEDLYTHDRQFGISESTQGCSPKLSAEMLHCRCTDQHSR